MGWRGLVQFFIPFQRQKEENLKGDWFLCFFMLGILDAFWKRRIRGWRIFLTFHGCVRMFLCAVFLFDCQFGAQVCVNEHNIQLTIVVFVLLTGTGPRLRETHCLMSTVSVDHLGENPAIRFSDAGIEGFQTIVHTYVLFCHLGSNNGSWLGGAVRGRQILDIHELTRHGVANIDLGFFVVVALATGLFADATRNTRFRMSFCNLFDEPPGWGSNRPTRAATPCHFMLLDQREVASDVVIHQVVIQFLANTRMFWKFTTVGWQMPWCFRFRVRFISNFVVWGRCINRSRWISSLLKN